MREGQNVITNTFAERQVEPDDSPERRSPNYHHTSPLDHLANAAGTSPSQQQPTPAVTSPTGSNSNTGQNPLQASFPRYQHDIFT